MALYKQPEGVQPRNLSHSLLSLSPIFSQKPSYLYNLKNHLIKCLITKNPQQTPKSLNIPKG